MDENKGHIDAPHPGKGLEGFQHFWPPDEEASGYGVAAYLGTGRITCRLFDLKSNDLLDTQRLMGDFERLSGDELNAIINDIFVLLAQNARINLSKLDTAVISGATMMMARAAGIELDESAAQASQKDELLGYDIEYLMAGPSSIAVGEAYYVPCLSAKIGGDFLCSLLAININAVEEPLLFVNTGPDEETNTVIAYGDNKNLDIAVLPLDMPLQEGITRFLAACGMTHEDVGNVLVTGWVEADVGPQLADRVHVAEDAAIEGASAVLLSITAEDELSRIVESCKIIDLCA